MEGKNTQKETLHVQSLGPSRVLKRPRHREPDTCTKKPKVVQDGDQKDTDMLQDLGNLPFKCSVPGP